VETGADDDVAGSRTEGGIVTCADPAARAAAPLRRLSDPGGWDEQPVGTLAAPTGWGVVVADLDGDTIPDVFLPQPAGDQLFFGTADGHYREDDGALPAPDGVPATGASAADYDGDGDLDLFVARHGPDALYVNDGAGRFTDVSAAAGVDAYPYDSIGGAWGDLDGDGDLDLFVSTWATRTDPPDPDQTTGDPNLLWENDGAGAFRDRADTLVPFRTAGLGWTYAAGWWDVDGVGGPELYITSDKGHGGFSNTLLHYDDGAFVDRTDGTGLAISNQSMGLSAADLNDDGVPDFLVSDWGAQWLMLSDGQGGWYDAALARGLGLSHTDQRVVSWGGELADLDNDGDDDVVAVFGPDDLDEPTYDEEGTESTPAQPDGLWLQGDDGSFVQVADAWGFADVGVGRGIAVADLDGDGWLDFVRRDVLGSAHIDLQACGAEGWLSVDLAGPAPNTRGIGARIEVEAGGRRWTRWIQAGSTNLGTSIPPEAHFGLGDRDTIDRLRVTWPDGGQQTFTDVATRQHVRVTRE
jgi:hypothetical protein